VKPIRFTAPARHELLSEVAYYNDKEPGLGALFNAAIEEAVKRAVAFPLTGSPASKSTRRMFVKNFPFAVVYRVDAEGIVIFAVAHHSRRPGYWRERPTENLP